MARGKKTLGDFETRLYDFITEAKDNLLPDEFSELMELTLSKAQEEIDDIASSEDDEEIDESGVWGDFDDSGDEGDDY